MTTVTAAAITGPSSDESVIVPLYSTLSMWGLSYSLIYYSYLTFKLRQRMETSHAAKRKIECLYRIMAILTITYSLITTFMSIPNYAGDDNERNLKHALLNISADIATLSQCVACCFGVLRYCRSMKVYDYVTCVIGLIAGVLGLLSSIGSQSEQVNRVLGNIRYGWVGFPSTLNRTGKARERTRQSR